jgi:hypothetical protein
MGRLMRWRRRVRPLASALALGALVLSTTAGVDCGDCRPHPPPRTRDGDCGQAGYTTHPGRQQHAFTWVMNASTVPAYLDRAGAVRAIRRGTATMQRARTRCAAGRDLRPDLPSAIYAGPTERQANITPDALCFPPSRSDGINVVSFGALPQDVLAVTCTYVVGRDIWQSDIRLNDGPGLFTLTPRDKDCVSSYDLQGVVTHERGHSFGLAHVPEDASSDDLTMSSILSRCDASARTLGWGDVLGLSRLYPRQQPDG